MECTLSGRVGTITVTVHNIRFNHSSNTLENDLRKQSIIEFSELSSRN